MQPARILFSNLELKGKKGGKKKKGGPWEHKEDLHTSELYMS